MEMIRNNRIVLGRGYPPPFFSPISLIESKFPSGSVTTLFHFSDLTLCKFVAEYK